MADLIRRWDAAAVEARPADLVLVDEGDLQPELARPEGRRVAAGACAEHDEIEIIGRADGHGVSAPFVPRTGAAWSVDGGTVPIIL